jgi:hypothetical protein
MYGPKQALPICLAVIAFVLLAGTLRSASFSGFGTGRVLTRADEPQGIPPFDNDSVRIYIGVVK